MIELPKFLGSVSRDIHLMLRVRRLARVHSRMNLLFEGCLTFEAECSGLQSSLPLRLQRLKPRLLSESLGHRLM